MSKTIVVFAELRDGALRRVALEALGAARQLAGKDGAVHAVLACSGGAAEEAAALTARGADVVHIADDPPFAPTRRRRMPPPSAQLLLRCSRTRYCSATPQ